MSDITPEILCDSSFKRLGIDIGKVIIGVDTDTPGKTIFGPDFLNTPEVPDAINTIRSLGDSGNWEQIHLVSKCGPNIQNRAVEWMAHNKFFERSGVLSSNLHFCLERSDKASIVRELGITHFIDDRIDVLEYMEADIIRGILLINGRSGSPKQIRNKNFFVVGSWTQVPGLL